MSKVCVITPTYKGKSLLERICVPSVRAQSFKDYTHYIIHDGPEKDETKEYITGLNDPRIVYESVPRAIPEPDNGAVRFGWGNKWHTICGFNCTNHARKRLDEEHKEARYIFHLDHDDAWAPNHIEMMVRALDVCADKYMAWPVAMVFSDNYFSGYAGSPFNFKGIMSTTHAGPAWSSIVYKREGPYDRFFAGHPGICSDWDWLKKFLRSTKQPAVFIPRVSVYVFRNCAVDFSDSIMEYMRGIYKNVLE